MGRHWNRQWGEPDGVAWEGALWCLNARARTHAAVGKHDLRETAVARGLIPHAARELERHRSPALNAEVRTSNHADVGTAVLTNAVQFDRRGEEDGIAAIVIDSEARARDAKAATAVDDPERVVRPLLAEAEVIEIDDPRNGVLRLRAGQRAAQRIALDGDRESVRSVRHRVATRVHHNQSGRR